MLGGMSAKAIWRAHKGKALAASLLAAIGVIIVTGFAGDAGRAVLYKLPSGGLGAAPPIYDGPASLEERILEADVIARVRLLSMSTVIETFYSQGFEADDEWIEDTAYGSALEFRFEVIEYLKGEGGGEIVGIVYGNDYYETKAGARAFGANLIETHDTTWDDREAIVFMNRRQGIASTTEQPDRYALGFADYGDFGSDSYTIKSIHAKRWLPAAFSGGDINEIASRASAGGNDESELRFLTGAEPAEGEFRVEITDYHVANSAHNKALGTGSNSSTITLSNLKSVIAELQEEVAKGDGTEEYRECVLHKYSRNREVEYKYKESGGRTYSPGIYVHELESGSPADTVFAIGPEPIPDNFNIADLYVNNIDWKGWIEGEDMHLFRVLDDKALVGNARPLPGGEYHFYYNSIDAKHIPCNAYPDRLRTREGLAIDVTAPSGTLHEAFFDPVALDGTVGADGKSGVLKPASFAFDGDDAMVERIDWLDGQARMALSPHIALPSHHIDFIALDGSISLRLDFNDAVDVADADGARTLVWGVCSQPWQPGDLLMLRIAAGVQNDGILATNDSECL